MDNLVDDEKPKVGNKDESKDLMDEERRQQRKMKKLRHKMNKNKRWFEAKHNYIYVENLPTDVTEKELADEFRKCGAIKLEAATGEDAIRLYKDNSGRLKGDARIGFVKPESIELAVQMMDGSSFRGDEDHILKVSEAVFEQKGEDYRPRKAQKVDKLTQLQVKSKQE